MIDTKPFVKTLGGKPVAVFGLGVSGLASVKALQAAGAQVHAWDDDLERRQEAQKQGAVLKDLIQEDLSVYGCLVPAPGVPLHHPLPHPVVAKAREAGVEIIGDLEILHRCGHGRKTIGITGTNGKSTTTALTGHILKECGLRAPVGGNIGTASLTLDAPDKNGAFVLEMSSYQIDLCPSFRPDIAILLNITPDHIDRHGTMEEYAQVKARLFEGPGTAICGIDDELSAKICDKVKEAGTRAVIPISVKKPVEDGVHVLEGKLFDRMEEVGDVQSVRHLLGVHNHQNICAAYAAARAMGLERGAILEAVKTYPGLPHRQFLVRTINGVAYINDSKATNADATAKALACYRNIYWIAGGRPKEGGLSGLEPYMDRIKQAFLIGEAMEEFGTWLDKHNVVHSFCKTLDVAVLDAHRAAQGSRGQPGGTGTVLLSPACASFDQFRNFEDRGETFATLVNNLEEEMAA